MELVYSVSTRGNEDDNDDALIESVIAALRKGRRLEEYCDEGELQYVAGSLIAEGPDEKSIEAWVSHSLEVLSEVVEEVDDALAEGVIEALRREGVLEWQFANGTEVLAVLDEDGEWHDAVICSELELGSKRQKVLFTQWAKPQWVPRDSLCLLTPDDDDGDLCAEGNCLLCHRSMPLTYHHLVPKEEHERWIGKSRPLPWKEQVSPEEQEIPLSRSDLGNHGIMICRPCHSAVHRLASNRVLAQSLCTLKALAAHSDIKTWVQYVRKRKTTSAIIRKCPR